MTFASMARRLAAFLVVAAAVVGAAYYLNGGPATPMTDQRAREMRSPPYDGPTAPTGRVAR